MDSEYDRIRAACSKDEDWLRSSVGDAFFAESPQEVIASQVGNQYMRSSMNQLRLAVSRLNTGVSSLPMSWFLFFVELFSAGKATSVMYGYDTDVGMTTPYEVSIIRNDDGRISKLGFPGGEGCSDLVVRYEGAKIVGLVDSSWDCILPSAPPPTKAPTSAKAQTTPNNSDQQCDYTGYAAVVATSAGCSTKRQLCQAALGEAADIETRQQILCQADKPCGNFAACVEEVARSKGCSSHLSILAGVKNLRAGCATLSSMSAQCILKKKAEIGGSDQACN